MNNFTKFLTIIFLLVFHQLNGQNIPAKNDVLLWLSADSVHYSMGNYVDTIYDRSGNNYHAVQPNITNQAILDIGAGINNKNLLIFDGSNDFYTGLEIPDFESKSITIFSIVSGESQTGVSAGIFTINSYPDCFWFARRTYNSEYFLVNAGQIIETTGDYLPNSGFNYKLLAACKNYGVQASIYGNGNFITSSTNATLTGTFSNTIFNIGRTPGYNYLKGNIATIIIYDRALSDIELKDVSNALQIYYGDTVNLGSDISSTTWDSIPIDAGTGFNKYRWSTGETSQTIKVGSSNNYSVTVTNLLGGESFDTINVTFPHINSPIVSSDTTICLYDTLLWNTNLNSDFSHEWNTGQVSSTIQIFEPDEYSVKITDLNGNVRYSDTITISIDSFPTHNSLGLPRAVCKYEAVTLETQGADIQSWSWSNDSTQTYINIETAGEYSVTVTNARGCSDSDTNTYSISGVAPSVNFAADTVCFNDSTSFINLSSIEGGFSIDSVLWDFGDGTNSKLFNVKHRYATSDTFIVQLTAYSGDCSNFYQDSIVVKQIPTASFYVPFDYTHCTNKPVNFIDTSISSLPITNYLWDFGNGITSTLQNPNYTFASENFYDVQLNIQNSIGCTDSILKTLTIQDALPLPFDFDLLQPKNSYTYYLEKTISFSWETSNNSVYYLFEIAKDSNFTIDYYTDSIIETNYNYNIPDTGTWYWQIKAFNLCGDYIQSNKQEIHRNLVQTDGLALWLSADSVHLSSGNLVDTLYDLSNNGNHLVQNTINKQVTRIINDTINGNYSLIFDGIDDLFTGDTLIGLDTSSITVYAIANGFKHSGTLASIFSVNDFANGFGLSRWTDQQELFLSNKGAYINSNSDDLPNQGFGFNIFKSVKSFNNIAEIYINDSIVSSGTSPTLVSSFTNGDLNVGYAPGFQYWKGNITEIFVYNKVLSSNEQKQVEAYLQQKYAPPLDLNSNINIAYGFPDTTISAHKPWFTSYKWSSSTSSLSDTVAKLSVSQSGTYHVTVTDIFGFTSTDSVTVTYPQPINISDSTICLYDTITWDPELSGDYTYEWHTSTTSTGSVALVPHTSATSTTSAGSVAAASSVALVASTSKSIISTDTVLKITQTGEYSLIIRDKDNNPWYSDTITIIVDEFPGKVSLGNDTTLCAGNRIYLKDGFADATNYLWNSSTGSLSPSQYGEYIILQDSGTYTVTATNSFGCVGIDTATFAVGGIAPTVSFEYEQVCYGDTTEFTDLSSTSDGSTITNWEWNFGDFENCGTDARPCVSTDQFSKYKYFSPGEYELQFTVTSSNNCSNSIKQLVKIFELPRANFMPEQGCSNYPVSFTDKSIAADQTITQWQWDIIDCGIEAWPCVSSLQNPEFTFTETGEFNIQLISTTDKNCKDTLIKTIEIKAGPNTDFSYSPACEGKPVYFSDASESYLNLPLTYNWIIDGNNFTSKNPVYSFTGTNDQVVYLKTTQSFNGCFSEKTDTIRISENPVANFSVPNICVHSPVQFTNHSSSPSNSLTFWEYEIDTIGIRREANPWINFTSPGSYEISYRVEDDKGCRDTITKTIEVNDLPFASFLMTPIKGSVPLFVDFENLSTNANGYYWTFGDGGFSEEKNPSHEYADSGSFAINMIAYSPFGCIDSMQSTFKGIIPHVDLLVSNTTANISNGFMVVQTTIQNQGTLDYDQVELFYKTNQSQKIREVLDIPLLAGHSLIYTFKTQIEVNQRSLLTHVCVSAFPIDLNDELPDNNEDCFAFEDSFELLNSHPNPADEEFVIEYIIPYDSEVSIKLFNLYGKYLGMLYNGQSLEGYNRHRINVSSYLPGVYIYRIEYEDIIKSYQMIVE